MYLHDHYVSRAEGGHFWYQVLLECLLQYGWALLTDGFLDTAPVDFSTVKEKSQLAVERISTQKQSQLITGKRFPLEDTNTHSETGHSH